MTELLTGLRALEPPAAAAALRAAGPGGRGFLGLDPATQNDVLLARELTRLDAQVYRAGAALVGCAANPDQPRQAYVATTSAEPGPVRALLDFLATYGRRTSFVALVPAGAPAAGAFAGCGFSPVGLLPAHRYSAGSYSDVQVWEKAAAE